MVLGKPQTDPTLEWFLSHCHIHKYPSKSTLIHQGEKSGNLVLHRQRLGGSADQR